MSPPEVWGPPIWTLFHVLAEKINERVYPFYAGQLFSVIKNICSALPCPECTSDASIFLGKIKIQDLKTKFDFKNMVYLFHNYVNAKKRKRLYNYSGLEIYKNYNIINVFNRFISVYHTRGNMKLLAESFQRQNIIKNIRAWFSKNIMAFMTVQQPVNLIQTQIVSEEENIVVVENIVVEETPIVTEKTVVIEETPITNSEETVIIEEETVVTQEDTVVIEEETVVIEEETVITEEETVTNSEDTVTNLEEQVVTEEETVTNSEDTVTNLEEQVVTEDTPVVSEEETVVSEETPLISEEQAVNEEQAVIQPKKMDHQQQLLLQY